MTAPALPSPKLLAKTIDGLIFSPQLVPAVLEGRKDVTRRTGKRWLKRKAGELLFVRENWRLVQWGFDVVIEYAADGARVELPIPADRGWYERETDRVHAFRTRDEQRGAPLRPSILLPRWASRCVVRLTEPPRLERLNDITEDEARREGVKPFPRDPEGDCWTDGKHRTAFEYLWNELNGWSPNAFHSNPEVVRIAFELVTGDA